MSFWETVGAGACIAAFTALIALAIALLVTDRRDRSRARRERDEAAAAEFYRAYGSFFAVWKSWNDFREPEKLAEPPDCRRGTAPPGGDERLGFLTRVAEAEGLLESFLVRLTLEHRLSQPELDRLWCFRRGYKQLRYAVVSGEPLNWFRTDSRDDACQRVRFRSYRAFKSLAASTAELLIRDGAASGAPVPMSALERLEYVTGSSDPLKRRYVAETDAFGAELRRQGLELRGRVWRWVAIAERLRDREAARRRRR